MTEDDGLCRKNENDECPMIPRPRMCVNLSMNCHKMPRACPVEFHAMCLQNCELSPKKMPWLAPWSLTLCSFGLAHGVARPGEACNWDGVP